MPHSSRANYLQLSNVWSFSSSQWLPMLWFCDISQVLGVVSGKRCLRESTWHSSFSCYICTRGANSPGGQGQGPLGGHLTPESLEVPVRIAPVGVCEPLLVWDGVERHLRVSVGSTVIVCCILPPPSRGAAWHPLMPTGSEH